MNIEIQVVHTYIFIRYLPVSGIPGSYGDYFQHLEKLPSCFQSGYTIYSIPTSSM